MVEQTRNDDLRFPEGEDVAEEIVPPSFDHTDRPARQVLLMSATVTISPSATSNGLVPERYSRHVEERGFLTVVDRAVRLPRSS
jgi:hypothetical protein